VDGAAAVILLGVMVAGGFGAAARLLLDGAVRERTEVSGLGTVLVNLSGSLLLGLVAGLAAASLLPSPVRLVVGTGFLGGYTTFSTASVETVRLLQQRRWAAASLLGLGMLLAAVALAGAGMWLGLELGG
jgi:CrcB protein